MAYGLEVYNASGVLQFDLTNRLTRLHLQATYSVPSGGNLSIAVPGLTLDGTWGVVAMPTSGAGDAAVSLVAGGVYLSCPAWSATAVGILVVFRV
jgi:hypothetical protein